MRPWAGGVEGRAKHRKARMPEAAELDRAATCQNHSRMTRGKNRIRPAVCKVFHRTTLRRARSIILNGFRDGTGHYLSNLTLKGVWLTDRPDLLDGVKGDTCIVVRLKVPKSSLKEFEWTDPVSPYREWLVPAEFLRKHILSIEQEAENDDFLFYKALVRKVTLARQRAARRRASSATEVITKPAGLPILEMGDRKAGRK